MTVQTRDSQIKVGSSRPNQIAVQLAEIAARLDTIFATWKDDIEEIKSRMSETPARGQGYEAVPIISEVLTAGNDDRLNRGNHNGSNLDIEIGAHNLMGVVAVGDDGKFEETDDDDGKDMVEEDTTVVKPKANHNNPSKDQHETMDDVMYEKSHGLQSFNMIPLHETIERHCLADFDQKRLEKIGGLERDMNRFLEKQIAVESVVKSEIGFVSSRSSTLAEIVEDKFTLCWVYEERDAIMVKLKSQIETGGSFEDSLSRKLPHMGKYTLLSTTRALMEYFMMNYIQLIRWASKLIYGKLSFSISKVFIWSCKAFVLCRTTYSVAAHWWVSVAGYLVSELLIAWENYELPMGQLVYYRLEDKSFLRPRSIDTNPASVRAHLDPLKREYHLEAGT